jgi:hypothetical protein
MGSITGVIGVYEKEGKGESLLLFWCLMQHHPLLGPVVLLAGELIINSCFLLKGTCTVQYNLVFTFIFVAVVSCH